MDEGAPQKQEDLHRPSMEERLLQVSQLNPEAARQAILWKSTLYRCSHSLEDELRQGIDPATSRWEGHFFFTDAPTAQTNQVAAFDGLDGNGLLLFDNSPGQALELKWPAMAALGFDGSLEPSTSSYAWLRDENGQLRKTEEGEVMHANEITIFPEALPEINRVLRAYVAAHEDTPRP